MSNEALTKKRQERINRKNYLMNRLLTHFVFGIIYSIYVMGLEMATVAAYPKFAEGVRFWTIIVGLAGALILAILPKFAKKMKTEFFWRTSVYFLAFLGGLHVLIELWTKLTPLASVGWLKVFGFGNEWSAWGWSHALIWIGVLISVIVYMVEYRRVGKDKR